MAVAVLTAALLQFVAPEAATLLIYRPQAFDISTAASHVRPGCALIMRAMYSEGLAGVPYAFVGR